MSNHGPTHRVYTLIPRKDAEGQDDTFWLNIGAAFPHKDAKGYNLVLQALPLDGNGGFRIMLPFKRTKGIAVGTTVAGRPPHRPGRAQFRHPVLTLSD